MLGALGFAVNPADLHVNEGSNKYNDWCKWTAHGIRQSNGMEVAISSFATMTTIVRSGEIGIVADDWHVVEVS